jgi:predicted transcriptional regulator
MPDTAPTITTYLSDMLALERHVLQPLQHQIADRDVVAMPTAHRVVAEAVAIARTHEQALQERLDALGGHAGSPVKSTVSAALGGIATALGGVRKTEVAKYLRDDYTALSLASASYTMLQTTARALNDEATAQLAKEHLSDYAGIIMKLSATLPTITIADLRNEGASVDQTVTAEAERATEAAWREGAARSRGSDVN